MTPRGGAAKRWALRGVAALLALYAAVLGLMYASEDRLVYQPSPYPGDEIARVRRAGCESVEVISKDGTRLDAIYSRHPAPERHVLFLHGNGGNVYYLGAAIRSLSTSLVASILVVDYRGYGKSVGAPTERGVLEDAEAAHARLAELSGVPAKDLVVMGHSLGGAIAVHVASTRGARALVLQNTFLDLPDVAGTHYPWAPARLLMKNRFTSREKIAHYKGPLFQSHVRSDTLVPFRSGRALFDLSPSPAKKFVQIDAGDHNDAPPPGYHEALLAFLRGILTERD